MNKKQKWVTNAPTEVLERITSTLERDKASEEYPLGGLAHINGVGQIPVSMMRSELARRKAEVSA